jgi:hypothetical protein
MERQTFVNQMKARGYETTLPSPTGNVTATKGDIAVRLIPLADYIVYIDTPIVSAIIRKDATDAEMMNIIAALTD